MTSFAEKVIQYFKEQIKEDVALAKVFDESKINECEVYVRKQAQKQAVRGCAVIEDAVVYKWSRDFYLGDTEESKETKAKTTEKNEKPKEKVIEPKIVSRETTVVTLEDNKGTTEKKDPFDMCLFDGLTDEELWGDK